MSKSDNQAWLEGMDDAFARLAALHPKMIDLSLGRLERLLLALGSPERSLPPVVHIAGTNGKGSVAAFLLSLIEASGQTAHVYTSPHLVRFNERIALRGVAIDDARMTACARRVEAANDKHPLTFFEAMTATAFLAFSEAEADFCILETGLGGRLDATNVVPKPLLSVITSIDYDHQAFLGDSLKEIAFEKAGIIKPDCPIILAPQEEEAFNEVKAQAQNKASPLFYAPHHWQTQINQNGFTYKEGDKTYQLPLPSLIGDHQIENAALALFASKWLSLPQDEKFFATGLTNARWHARLEKIKINNREIYLDGGHNNEAGKILAEFLLQEKKSRPCYLFCALRATKSAEGFLSHFVDRLDGLFALPLPDGAAVPGEGAKGYSPHELYLKAQALGIKAQEVKTLEEGLEAIPANPQPLILVAGSLLLAGDVLKRFL